MSDHAVLEPLHLEPDVMLKPARIVPRRNPVWGVLGFILGSIPTLLVLASAGAIGWWGQQSHWKLPKFSELNGTVAAPDDWCADHKVPESICIECDDTLLPKAKARGWCSLHGIPECVHCNPELAQLAKVPVLTTADLSLTQRALDFTNRVTSTPNCRTHARRIQFTSAQDADKSGIAVEPVWTAPAVEFVTAPGEIGYDQTRVAHMSARSPGTVWKVYKHVGQDVKAGEVLALVDATEVGKTKSDLVQALVNLQLKQRTLASVKDSGAAVPVVRVRELEAAVREAEIRVGASCQALTNLGLPIKMADVLPLNVEQIQAKLHLLGIPSEVAATLSNVPTTNLLPLVAPLDGRVMSREVVAGEVVDTLRILFEIVDTRSLWLTLDVKGEDAHRIAIGQPVRFTPDNGRAELIGTIAWRNSQADVKTRTVKVRADLSDPEQKLVTNTYGSGRVILRDEPKAISVPSEAVQWDGCCNVVFIRDKDYLKSDFKVFHVRKVRVGAISDKSTEIAAGVLPGELVVTKGSGLLLTELLRGSLGEGCACHSKK